MAAFERLVSEGQVGHVTREFQRIIEASMVSHPVRNLTHAIVKERFDMCAKIFETLRSDLKWSLPRILDQLPAYLGCELDGVDWKPNARTVWTPGTPA